MTLPDVTISSLVAPLAVGGGDPRAGWLPVALLLVIAIGFGVTNLIVSLIVGPSRTGPGKETTYESGMAPVGSTRRRFNVRFYLVAILFVAFDVEIVILYPWASSFAAAVADNSLNNGLGTLMLGGMLVFTLLIVVGYAYDVGKGVLKFE
ncbi:MAG: NADH-quinone oxidoreductase subunit A [Planctomycetota bacterium]